MTMRLQRRHFRTAAAGVLVLFALHAWASARDKTPTVDEFAHVPAGYLGLATGDFTLYGKTPPLGRTLFSLPLLLDRPVLPPPPTGNRMAGWYPWLYASGFFRANVERYGIDFAAGVYHHARAVVIGLAVLLGIVLFVWGEAWHGPPGGLLAVLLFTLDPTVLAHSRLATVDMAESRFFVCAGAFFVRHLVSRTSTSLVCAGVFAGAALATKFTAVLLAPVFVGLAIVRLVRTPTPDRPACRRRLGMALAALAGLTLVVVNLAYGLSGTGTRLGDLRLESGMLSTARRVLPPWTPVPFPADFVRGFDAQQIDVERGDFPNYLAGDWSRTGWWYYYPLAWLAKTPLPACFILAMAAIGSMVRRRRPCPPDGAGPSGDTTQAVEVGPPSRWAVLLVILLIGGVACFLSRLDIGVRYLLPIYPFVFLAAGSAASTWRQSGSRAGIALGAAVVLLAAATFSAFPHYLAFFNSAAGGLRTGWSRFANSNADWGQDLIFLRRELEARGIGDVRLAYFGGPDPAYFGIRYTVPLPGASGSDALLPASGSAPTRFRPGDYAISANLLVGLPYQVVDHGRWVQAGQDLTQPQQIYAWFRDRSPAAVIGGSILLFHVDPGAS
ncbi:MAG: ArnT family glycosyltransferase [Acidobacteriota bacterium]